MYDLNDPTRPTLTRRFFRGHGLGNDYLVHEAGDDWTPEPGVVARVCHRTQGLGSDGIVCLLTTEEPFRLRMFNPDGSEFERSGNGLRILGTHLHRTGRVGDAPFRVVTGGDEVEMRVHGVEGSVYDVSVEMGRASIGAEAVGLDGARVEPASHALTEERPATIGFTPEGESLRLDLVPVSVGNPHAVVWGIPTAFGALVERDLHRLGAAVAFDGAFARGVNVQLARVVDDRTLEILIWERGVGPTSASGTSACAAAVSAVASGRLEPGELTVRMPGGELRVTVSAMLDVVLRGPVQAVADGELDAAFLADAAKD